MRQTAFDDILCHRDVRGILALNHGDGATENGAVAVQNSLNVIIHCEFRFPMPLEIRVHLHGLFHARALRQCRFVIGISHLISN